MEWKKDEIDFLVENYPKYGLNYCVENLNRSRRSVQLKRKRLNIDTQYSIKNRWREDNLRDIVEKSNTYSDCLKKLGINNLGSSYNTLKKYIKKYNINNSHFLDPNEQIKKLSEKKNMNEVLVENSTYSRRNLKQRLYEDGLKERKCELCGQGEEWNGKHMSLVLDHINGINNDNRIENIRIICPNCNATLDTFCRGNYKEI